MAGQKLGFIGVGQMGGPMASRLLDAGHELVVFDTSAEAVKPLAERGATIVGSAAEVAAQVETVLVSLPTPAIVEAVALGPGGVVEGGKVKVMVDLSTTGPTVATRVAAGLAEKGITQCDAPVSGGVAGARAGTLAVMLACPEGLRAGLEPVLAVFGKVFHVGEKPGLGQVAKLGNNMLSVAAIALTSEVTAMGVKAGLDPNVLVEIFSNGTGRNSATMDKFPNRIIPRKFDAGFATGLAYKDVRLCVDESETLGVPMIAGAVIREIMALTNAKYGPDSDFTLIAKLIEEWAGVEIKG